MSLAVSSKSNYIHDNGSASFGRREEYGHKSHKKISKDVETSKKFAILSGICGLATLAIATVIFFKIKNFEPVVENFKSQLTKSGKIIDKIHNFGKNVADKFRNFKKIFKRK